MFLGARCFARSHFPSLSRTVHSVNQPIRPSINQMNQLNELCLPFAPATRQLRHSKHPLPSNH